MIPHNLSEEVFRMTVEEEFLDRYGDAALDPSEKFAAYEAIVGDTEIGSRFLAAKATLLGVGNEA